MTRDECELCGNKAYEYGIGRTTWVHLDNKNGTVALPRSDFEEILQVVSRYEQKPCEDAISREAVLDQLDQSTNILEATDRIKAMRGAK